MKPWRSESSKVHAGAPVLPVILVALLVGLSTHGRSAGGEDLVSRDFAFSQGKDKLEIGVKGGRTHRYGIRKNVAKRRVGLEMQEKGVGRASFQYDERTSTVTVRRLDRSVSATEGDGGMVDIGKKRCVGVDSTCIAQAFVSELPGVNATEVAAVIVAIGPDVGKLKHGKEVRAAMRSMLELLHEKRE